MLRVIVLAPSQQHWRAILRRGFNRLPLHDVMGNLQIAALAAFFVAHESPPMKPLITLCLVALLSGCASKPDVISVPCVSASDLPPETPKPVLSGNEKRDLGIMTRTALDLLDEASKLRALLSGCVG